MSFVPEAGDQIAVARGNFRRSLRQRRFAVRAVILLVLGAGLGAAVGLIDDRVEPWLIALGISAAAMWLMVILLGTWLLIPRRSARLFRQQRSLDRKFDFTWSETGIEFQSETSRSTLTWAQYHRWFESGRVFAFGLNEQMFHWVPKRAMRPDQAEDLRATALASGLPSA